jgi:hypothetical protein
MATMTDPARQAGSDERLMQRIQADDIRAFEELYDRYSALALALRAASATALITR